MSFEDIKKDPKAHIIKIAKFIGYDLSNKAIDLIVERTSAEAVSPRFVEMFKDMPSRDAKRSSFVGKDIVGDWVNYFSKEQSDYADAKCKESKNHVTYMIFSTKGVTLNLFLIPSKFYSSDLPQYLY